MAIVKNNVQVQLGLSRCRLCWFLNNRDKYSIEFLVLFLLWFWVLVSQFLELLSLAVNYCRITLMAELALTVTLAVDFIKPSGFQVFLIKSFLAHLIPMAPYTC